MAVTAAVAAQFWSRTLHSSVMTFTRIACSPYQALDLDRVVRLARLEARQRGSHHLGPAGTGAMASACRRACGKDTTTTAVLHAVRACSPVKPYRPGTFLPHALSVSVRCARSVASVLRDSSDSQL